jgi:hypothetical protein
MSKYTVTFPGCMTSNNGFWIGWLDLLTPSFTITLNYNHLIQLTVNDCLRLAPFLTGLRVSSLLLWLTWFWFTNHLRTTKDEWRTKNHLRTNHVSPLYNFGANRIEITISNSCFIISCPFVAVETDVDFVATLWFPRAYPLLRKCAWRAVV